jgi:hypothetical protein
MCPLECKCGAVECRGRVSDRDWRLPELRVRYAGHWHPVIEARIASEISGQPGAA